MNTFLEHVAQDIINKYGHDLSYIAVVFPNKRASLFLNEYLARMVDKPIWSPSYVTISELFRKHSDLVVADQIKLICDLHKSFTKFVDKDETLDHFYGWGQVLLSDFDDIDKNMADPKDMFKNLTDIHELDDLSYLTSEQKAVLRSFFSTFSEEQDTELKKRFLMLWSNLYNIYEDYNRLLAGENLAYEGALYRKIVSDETVRFGFDTYIFVGFNMLTEVEQRLFKRLKDADRAKFYWDFDAYYMSQANTEAGYYIKQYLSSFPNELDNTDDELYNSMHMGKDITYISTMTENIQARYISDWLRKGDRIKSGKKTAIVLCDEQLLPTVIHCLPPEIGEVNVTTGYPLSKLPISSLINILISLQTVGVSGTDKYRLRYVSAALRHPYATYISAKSPKIISDLTNKKRYFPTRADLAQDDGLALLFSNIESMSMSDRNYQLSLWILNILQLIGQNSKDDYDPLMSESVFHAYTLMQRLSNLINDGDLNVDITTFQRLIAQLTQTTNIPFHGEPAIGVQIMGVLETRNLDFDHILVLSCNEGNMPKGVNDTSLIPYSLRKAFGLTTMDNKVSIYSYYFNNLIQRASDVTLLYNNSTEDGHTGEMSRFMLQLLVESEYKIKRKSLHVGQTPISQERMEIVKNDKVMDVLNAMENISPTAINRYIRCQLQFYYNIVAGLEEPDRTEDDQIDTRVFGNIFHKSAQLIYEPFIGRTISETEIDYILNANGRIENVVDQAFNEELFKQKDNNFHAEYNGTQIINRRVIIGYLRQLLKIDKRLAPINIKALEQEVFSDIKFDTSQGGKTIKIKGIIDRLDSVNTKEGRRTRVIDYKTGKESTNRIGNIKEVFAGKDISRKHTDYFLQTILYSNIIRESTEWNAVDMPVSPALVFIQHTSGNDYDPTLAINNQKIIDVKEYSNEFMEMLKQLLSEIFEPKLAFVPTQDTAICEYCPYRRLCGV